MTRRNDVMKKTPVSHQPRLWSIASITQMLLTQNALSTLTPHHAIVLAQRMRVCQVPQATVLFRAGDTTTDLMALVLEGEASVEATDAGAGESLILKIVGAGEVLGEMGIVANVPRSATVTAATDMTLAVLDQSAFIRLVKEVPDLACAFLSSLLQGVSSRLRESNRKLLTMTKINQSMYAELEASRDNEGHLAELLASASSFGMELPRQIDDKPSAPKNTSKVTARQTWDSQPPRFSHTLPV